ncbi:unnamed protein product [Peronospora belbahrii]|uniref:DUF4833 domain-containing protein n=1 Tax=Peronospora belbahrii TaxID=622444 RepID=A0AAU9L5E4_9STRA|nr:unnamed protein product [Peronospora belbahrii]
MSLEMKEKHYFTEEFPAHDYPYRDHIVIFERSKNAQLVVYTANFRDKKRRELDPKWPLDITWQSFGWTDHPYSNSTGMIERKLAWGYSHKATKRAEAVSAEAVGASYTVTLNALPSRTALLFVDVRGQVVLQVTINGVLSRLWKIYVKTNNTMAFVPKVLYVDLYGTNVNDDQITYERISISS